MKRTLTAIAAMLVLTGCAATDTTAEPVETGPTAVELCDQFDTAVFGMYVNIVLDGNKDYEVAYTHLDDMKRIAAQSDGHVRDAMYQLLDAMPEDDKIHLIKSPLHDDSTVFADNVEHLKYQCEAAGYNWTWTP